MAILNGVLGEQPTCHLELDLSQGPKPRDVLCCVHFYGLKEEVLRRVWCNGIPEFKGMILKILPDLIPQTLCQCHLMKPLLDQVKGFGVTYRWAFSLSLIVKKDGRGGAFLTIQGH